MKMNWIKKKNIFRQIFFLKQRNKNNKLEKIIRKIDTCSAKELNYVVYCLLQEFDYKCQILDNYTNLGIDIIAEKKYHRSIAVKCVSKNCYNSKKNKVGWKDIQAFKGIFLSNSYKQGIIVTNQYFSKRALEESNNYLLLLDRKDLLLLLTTYFPECVANAYYKDMMNKSIYDTFKQNNI